MIFLSRGAAPNPASPGGWTGSRLFREASQGLCRYRAGIEPEHAKKFSYPGNSRFTWLPVSGSIEDMRIRVANHKTTQACRIKSLLFGFGRSSRLVFLCILIASVLGCATEPKEIKIARGIKEFYMMLDSDPKLARSFERICINQAWEETRYTVGGESREPLYIGCDNDER